MYNWYYFYNKSDINEKDLEDLSIELEKSGYKFYQPWGLGAGPSPEQVILWLSNNQFLSTVALSILANYLYDVLKSVWTWYRKPKLKNKKIPMVEIFIKYKDSNKEIGDMRLKFRMDKTISVKEIEEIIKKIQSSN
jgi:hypothetical protein